MTDKLLVPLEPRAVWHRPYMPGDCPITREQLAQHTYIEQDERDEAIRAFLQRPPRRAVVRKYEPCNWRDAAVGVVVAASILVGWGWGLVVVLRWVGELIGL